jgi:hypothetical protein
VASRPRDGALQLVQHDVSQASAAAAAAVVTETRNESAAATQISPTSVPKATKATKASARKSWRTPRAGRKRASPAALVSAPEPRPKPPADEAALLEPSLDTPDANPDPQRESAKAAATKALTEASLVAASCNPRGGPSGTGKARIVYAPSGNVRSVEIMTEKFRDTVTASCIRMIYRRAKIPAFPGEPLSFMKAFTIPAQ